MAGLWCVNIGYGRKELAEAATGRCSELPFYNSFFKTTTPPAIELAAAARRGDAAAHEPACSSPARARKATTPSCAWCAATGTCWASPSADGDHRRDNAYHGSTMAGASLGGMKPHARAGRPADPRHRPHRPALLVRRGPRHATATSSGCAARRLAGGRRSSSSGADNVAAFIGEPVQGAGGVIIPPETYWPEIQRICRKYDMLLVADEVICGFGRTGHWFGCEHFGIEPDLMTDRQGRHLRLHPDRRRDGRRPRGAMP